MQASDSLWSISKRFLQKPSQWSQLWYSNPRIDNPDQLYPGDVLELTKIDGKPKLGILQRGNVKVDPRIRRSPIPPATPTVALSELRHFLDRSSVLSKKRFIRAPRIIGIERGHIVALPTHEIYVRRLRNSKIRDYDIVRRGKTYRDPVSKKVLGYQAIHVGDAHVKRLATPVTLVISHATQEVELGDRLIPRETNRLQPYYTLREPKKRIRGYVLDVTDGLDMFGQHDIVVINQGKKAGLSPGHVLAIHKRRREVKPALFFRRKQAPVIKLPGKRVGELMVFKTFKDVSYALVLSTGVAAASVFDQVRNP